MPQPEVRPVCNRREQKTFLSLPWKMHSRDPNWVPPLRQDQEELAGFRPHPFYAGANRVQTFVAWDDGRPVGRIAAIWNQDHIDANREQVGFFGFFECVDDTEVARRLFDAVRDWLAQRGVQRMRGPANPSSNYTWGMLIDGFDSPPTFMMTYNPPYYPRLLESYGYCKAQDLYAYLGNLEMLPRAAKKFGPLAEEIRQRFNATVRYMDPKRIEQDVREFLDVYNRATAGNWGYSPMSAAEIQHAAAGLKYLLVPELAAAVEVDGHVVGACFALPDYNPRIKAINGRLFPFGFLRLLWNKKKIKKARALSTNVLPEYQLMGLPLVLGHDMVAKALSWGKLEELEYSWVLESNHRSRGALEKGGAKRIKTYRVYDYVYRG
jgi:hypothetical protein